MFSGKQKIYAFWKVKCLSKCTELYIFPEKNNRKYTEARMTHKDHDSGGVVVRGVTLTPINYFWRDATISFKIYRRVKHDKIQVKFGFRGHLQTFDWFMALSWLRFRLMQKLYCLFLITFTFLQNYTFGQLLTTGHDYPVPVDKHDSDWNLPHPLTP